MISITDSVNVLALNLEISALLAKGAIKPVDPLSQLGGFYLTYFLIRNEGNGLRPVLDISWLNEILRVFLTTTDFLRTVAKRGMVHVCRLKRSTTFYFPISVGLQDLTYFFFSEPHGYLKHCHWRFVAREKDFYSLGMLQPQWVCRVSDLSLTTDMWKQRTESGQRIRSWALFWAQPAITVQHTADLKRSSLCSDVFKTIAVAGGNLFFYSHMGNHPGMRLSLVV